MLKLYIHENFVFCSKLVMYEVVVVVDSLMNLWLVGVVIVMSCCCCEIMLWVFMVMKIVMKFELYSRVLWKMGEIVICIEMMFLIQVSYGFECLFMSINVWINFGNQFGHWGIKNWDFGAKMGFFPRAELLTSVTNCHASGRRARRECCLWELAMASRTARRGELRSDSTPCFVFLHLFRTFLFWIDFWCKHESFR